jgi:hypothetical protein
VKINKVPYGRDMVIDIEDEKIAVQLMSGGAVRPLQMPAEMEVVKVPLAPEPAAADPNVQVAAQSFEDWVTSGQDARDYPPRGFVAQDTPAYRAYKVSVSVPTMASEAVPQRVLSNPGFVPTIRPVR